LNINWPTAKLDKYILKKLPVACRWPINAYLFHLKLKALIVSSFTSEKSDQTARFVPFLSKCFGQTKYFALRGKRTVNLKK